MIKKSALTLIFVLSLFLIQGCANHPTIWKTNGAYKGRTIWKMNNVKVNTPEHIWVNTNGKEVLWKASKEKESSKN